MSKITTKLTNDTVANMLATELKRKGIAMAEDSDTRDSILSAAAELILYDDSSELDIHNCVSAIDEYIRETLQNYPNYFITGEE